MLKYRYNLNNKFNINCDLFNKYKKMIDFNNEKIRIDYHRTYNIIDNFAVKSFYNNKVIIIFTDFFFNNKIINIFLSIFYKI